MPDESAYEKFDRQVDELIELLGMDLYRDAIAGTALATLPNLEAEHNAGDQKAILKCIHLCVIFDLSVPEWAKGAFNEACMTGYSGDLKSWDQVFGHPPTKDAAKRAARDMVYACEVHEMIDAAAANGEGLSDELFEKIGRTLGVGGKTTVKRLYARSREAADDVKRVLEERNAPPKPHG
jgi:hypothetical protein